MATRGSWLLAVIGCVVLAAGGCRHQGVQSPPGEKTKVKGDRTLVSHSEGIEPLWIQECPARTEHLLAFCGEAHEQASQQNACAEAYGDAVGKLRRMIGQKVDANLVQDAQGAYQFQIKSAESEPVTIRGVWEDQHWAEEYEGGSGHTHDCYVMLTYPTLQYEQLLHAFEQASVGRVIKAAKLDREGKNLASQGRHAEAVTLFERAGGLLSGLKEAVVTPEGLNSTLLAEQVTADLKASKEQAGNTAKTAMVVIRLMLDGRPSSDSDAAVSLQNQVKSWLAEKGLALFPGTLSDRDLEAVLQGDRQAALQIAAQKGTGWLIVIDVHSDFEIKDEVAFYAMAKGAFRMIRTADGRELAAVDLVAERGALPYGRGLHYTKDDAVKKAVENLRDKKLKNAVRTALGKI